MPPEKSSELLSFFQVQEFFRRLDAIGERIGQLASAVAVSAERERFLSEDLVENSKKLDELEKRLQSLESSALKTAGGFAVIVSLGAIVGFIVSSWSGIITFIGGIGKHVPK